MPAKPRIGRAPKRPEDKQSKVVRVSFTPAEYRRLEKLADGRPHSLVVRRALMKVHPEIAGARRQR